MSNNENNEIRDSFTSKTGFILACIGSAANGIAPSDVILLYVL